MMYDIWVLFDLGNPFEMSVQTSMVNFLILPLIYEGNSYGA